MVDKGALFDRQVLLTSGQNAFQIALGAYWLDYIPGGSDLVITFDSAGGPVERPDGLRDSWGQSFLQAHGFSILGVKPHRLEWYRGAELHAFFRSASFQDFARGFQRHIFYGTSMGGYGALAFANALPGALVIAHNPQSTLDSRLVPWERRFARGRSQDWSGDFADGAAAVQTARRIYMTYDPFHEQDRRHVERVAGPQVIGLKMPFLGHGTPEWLLKMRVLKEVSDLALHETLDEATFARLVRARKRLTRYYLGMYQYTRRPGVKAACLAHAAAIDPADGELLFFQILDLFGKRDYAGLVALYEMHPTLRGMPRSKSGEVAALIAMAMLRVGRSSEAKAVADKAADLSSDNVRDLTFMSDFYTEIGEFHRAADFAEAAIKVSPRRHTAYLALAKAQIGLGASAAAHATLADGETKCDKVDRHYLALKNKVSPLVPAR